MMRYNIEHVDVAFPSTVLSLSNTCGIAFGTWSSRLVRYIWCRV